MRFIIETYVYIVHHPCKETVTEDAVDMAMRSTMGPIGHSKLTVEIPKKAGVHSAEDQRLRGLRTTGG